MEKIEINKVKTEDIEALQKIGRQTFLETFSDNNDTENMKKYLEQSFATDKIAEELNNPASQFYFAILDDKVIGYLKVNTGHAQTESEAKQALEIERIYVLSAYHGKKVGQLLYEQLE